MATESKPYAYTVIAADPDLTSGDTLTLTAVLAPAWLTRTQTGAVTATLTGIPAYADAGSALVTLLVTDHNGHTAQQSFTLHVAALRRVYLPLVLRGGE